jgi:hypothetical protein
MQELLEPLRGRLGLRAVRFGWQEVMLAERDHRARLQTFGALGMLRDEAHFLAHCELVEPAVGDAVAMEIDLVAIAAQDEPAILRGRSRTTRPWSGTVCNLTSPRPSRT